MADYFNMEDKVVLITGDSSDLGLQIAEEFELDDSKIAFFSSIDERSQKMANVIQEEYDIEVTHSAVDLEDEFSVETGIQKVEDTFGEVEILVNTALRGSNELLIDRLSVRNIYPLFQISKISEDEDPFDMENKVAVVTGASGRIGVEIAQKFAVEGAKLILFSDDEEKLQEDVKSFEKSGVEAEYMVTYLDDDNSIKESLKSVLDSHGKIDYLVNAAGMGENKGVVDQLIALDIPPVFCIVWLQKFMNL